VWRPLVLLLLGSLTFVAGLGNPAITDSDEAFYAESAREMIARGDWITPYFNDNPRFEKPVLFYWLIAATYSVAGVGEIQARLWSAISGLGLVLVTYAAGRRWYGDTAGLVAGAIIATSFGAFYMARQSLPDLPLAFFMTVATWAAIEAVQLTVPASVNAEGASPTPDARRRWLLLSAAAVAFGLLAKGPVGVVLPGITAVLLMIWERRRRRAAGWLPVPVTDLLLALVVFALVALPWFLSVTLVHGVDYLVRFFFTENVERFATDRYNEPRSVLFFLPVILGGFMPWTPFLLLWVAPLARVVRRVRPIAAAELRIALWALVPFVFYSASMGKQPRYVLPCLTPLAILLAAAISSRIRATASRGSSRRDPLLSTLALATAATIMLVGVLTLRLGPMFRAADPSWGPTGPYLMMAAGAVAAIAAVFAPPRVTVGAVAGAAATTLLAVHASVFSPARPEPVETIAAAARAQGTAPSVCSCGAFNRNLVFYLRRFTLVGEFDVDAQRILEQNNHTIVVVDKPMLERIEQSTGRRYVRLAEATYLNLAALRADDLVNPDPARRLQHIVLASNR
jgi:4-amino-4-deoxy-L-arabinose transferase-like glycosyltransferase